MTMTIGPDHALAQLAASIAFADTGANGTGADCIIPKTPAAFISL